MGQETGVEEMEVVDQVADLEEVGVDGGSAGSDELEAKTQETHHPHPKRRHERMKGLQETSLRGGTRYGRWSGDTPQEWKIGRLVPKMNELFVMMMKELLGQIRK